MEVDILAVIGMAIPIVVLFAATILAMTFTHLLLSAKGNQYRTEASGIFGVVIFVIGEYILEIFQIPLTLFMILLVTPFMLVEAVRPSTGNQLTPPVLLDIKEHAGELASEVICVVQGKTYVSLAAIRVQGIPMESKTTSENELKLLLPLWENGKRSGTTYTLEAKIENGVVDLVVFVIDQDTDWKVSVEKTWQSKHVVESWLKQMDYSYSVLDFTQLSTAYQELELRPNMGIASPTVTGFDGRYFGILSVDGVTKDLSCSIEQVLNNLLDGDLSGRVMFSFSSASLPRFNGEVAKLKSTEGRSRTPYRVEEHQLRPIYKQMAEIEACEETGAFRAGVSVIIEGTHCEEVENKMKLI
ncbi:MAG: hypothetical protein E4H14_16450, partial [Candidatus Thorarchaeota archaeon]